MVIHHLKVEFIILQMEEDVLYAKTKDINVISIINVIDTIEKELFVNLKKLITN